MCTVTYLKKNDSFLLTMNRDERNDRAREIAPRRFRLRDTLPECVWPIDSDSGGTWIGANTHRIAACILNGYGEADAFRKNAESRGKIIPKVLQHEKLDKVERWLSSEFEGQPFKSFILIIAQSDGVLTASWDGAKTLSLQRHDALPMFYSSSSWNRENVIPWRNERFREWCASGCTFSPQGIPNAHLLQDPRMVEWSPMMRRDKSSTRSITQVSFEGTEMRMRYWKCPLSETQVPDRELELTCSLT